MQMRTYGSVAGLKPRMSRSKQARVTRLWHKGVRDKAGLCLAGLGAVLESGKQGSTGGQEGRPEQGGRGA